MFSSTFTTTKYRRTRSPLQISPLYDHAQSGVFESYHATHGDMTQAEADDLVERATAKRREGGVYIPHGLPVEMLQSYHRM